MPSGQQGLSSGHVFKLAPDLHLLCRCKNYNVKTPTLQNVPSVLKDTLRACMKGTELASKKTGRPNEPPSADEQPVYKRCQDEVRKLPAFSLVSAPGGPQARARLALGELLATSPRAAMARYAFAGPHEVPPED